MYKKSIFIFDGIFLGFVTLILSLVALDFFIPRPFSLIFSLCICFFTIITFIYSKNQKLSSLLVSKKEQAEIDAFIEQFNLMPIKKRLNIIENAITKKQIQVQRKHGGLYLKDKGVLILVKFGFEQTLKVDVVKAFNLISKNERAYILSDSFSLEVIEFACRFNGRIILANGQKLYAYLKENQALPPYSQPLLSKEKKKKLTANAFLQKKKFSSFFCFGIIFLATSYFVPIKLYYLIFGCAFLIFSLILRFFGKDNISQDEKYKNL